MDGDDGGWLDVFDEFDTIGDFTPGGGNGHAENLGSDRGDVKGVTRISKNIIHNYTKVVTGDLVFEDGSVRLAEELNLETTCFPGFAGMDYDGTADEGCGVWGSKNYGTRIAGEEIADYLWLAVVIMLMSDNYDGYPF